MTQEEEGMEVDVHTTDKALPENKMKKIVLDSLQKRPKPSATSWKAPLTVAECR